MAPPDKKPSLILCLLGGFLTCFIAITIFCSITYGAFVIDSWQSLALLCLLSFCPGLILALLTYRHLRNHPRK